MPLSSYLLYYTGIIQQEQQSIILVKKKVIRGLNRNAKSIAIPETQGESDGFVMNDTKKNEKIDMPLSSYLLV